MRLLDLVEEDDRIRLAAHRLGELAALVVADIAGRRADEPRNGVLLHVLGHVDADERGLGIEERLGQRLGQLGLADARRTEKQETADRPARILDAGARAEDGLGRELHGLVLTDDALMQHFLQAQELFLFALHEPGHGDARPLGDDLGDLLLGNLLLHQRPLAAFLLQRGEFALELRQAAVAELGELVEVIGALGALHLKLHPLDLLAHLPHLLDGLLLALPARLERPGLLTQIGELLAQRLEALPAGLVLLLLQRGLLDLELEHAPRELVEPGRHRVHLGADHGAGFVDEIDGLVGQETVGNVAVGKRDGADERVVLDAHAVMHLEALAQAAQD